MLFSLLRTVHPQFAQKSATAGGIVFGFLLLALFPAGVPALNDDFGYFRSVIQTLQHGRPWTDAWLEPWSASFTLISAAFYSITHSFYFCTYGLLCFFGALGFFASMALFRSRVNSWPFAAACAASLLTSPTLLWKMVEFTGVALYLPCLLGAVLFAERKQWGRFAILWLIALASRQSAVVWGVLPAIELIRSIRKPRPSRGKALWTCSFVLFSGVALFLILKLVMNKTYAQSVKTDTVLAHWSGSNSIRIALIGLGIFLVSAGVARYLIHITRPLYVNILNWRGLVVAFGAIGIVYLVSKPELQFLQIEHTLFNGPIGTCYLLVLVGIATVGWLTKGIALRVDYLLGALASLALICLREQVWDYYYIDIVVFGLFSPAIQPIVSDEANTNRLKAMAPLAILGACNIIFFLEIKTVLDRGWALCEITETALRANKLTRAELSFAPFGYGGWHLFPYYINHEGKNSSGLDGFGQYFIPGAIEVGQGYSKILHIFPRFRHEPPGDRTHLVAWGSYRYLWLFRAKFFLLRFRTLSDSPPLSPLPEKNTDFSIFPLNDREWSEFLTNRLTIIGAKN